MYRISQASALALIKLLPQLSVYFLKLYFVYMSVLAVCIIGTTCVPGASRDQKRASDSLELELQVLVSAVN